MDLSKTKIGFYGCGNIAKAIGGGLIQAGVPAANITACAPSDRCKADWTKWSTNFTNDCNELIANSDIIILCMKPYQFELAMTQAQDKLGIRKLTSKLFVSTLAGVPSSVLSTVIGSKIQADYRLIRSMPNTPCLVRAGCTVLSPHETATKDDISIVRQIFESVGKCEVVAEHLIPAVGGVAGSSPAFIYILIEAMADAGVRGGLTREMSQMMSAQAVLGSAKMVLESQENPGKLKDAVCSPGGTTIEGVLALEEKGFRHAIMAAVTASTKRSEEMTKLYGNSEK